MVTWLEGQVTRRKIIAEQATSCKGATDAAIATYPDLDPRRHTSSEW